MVNISLNKRTYTVKEVLNIYENLEPISIFDIQSKKNKKKIYDKIDKEEYNNKKYEKNKKQLYFMITICLIITLIIYFINRKTYYDR